MSWPCHYIAPRCSHGMDAHGAAIISLWYAHGVAMAARGNAITL